jgi:hypothetical protein
MHVEPVPAAPDQPGGLLAEFVKMKLVGPMKHLGVIMGMGLAGLLAGCRTTDRVGSTDGHSTREFAAAEDYQARQIHENGQAANRDDARNQAAADVNTQWVAEQRNAEKNASQAKMAKDLEEMGYASK